MDILINFGLWLPLTFHLLNILLHLILAFDKGLDEFFLDGKAFFFTAAILVDYLLFDDELWVCVELAIPTYAQGGSVDLAFYLLVVEGKIWVVEIERVESWITLCLKTFCRLFAIDQGW